MNVKISVDISLDETEPVVTEERHFKCRHESKIVAFFG